MRFPNRTALAGGRYTLGRRPRSCSGGRAGAADTSPYDLGRLVTMREQSDRMGIFGLGPRCSALCRRLARRWSNLASRVRLGLSRWTTDVGVDAWGGARPGLVVRVGLPHGGSVASRAGRPRGNSHPCDRPVARAGAETHRRRCADRPVGRRPGLRRRDLDCPASEVWRSRWRRAEGRRRRGVLPRHSLRGRAATCQRVCSTGARAGQDRVPSGA